MIALHQDKANTASSHRAPKRPMPDVGRLDAPLTSVSSHALAGDYDHPVLDAAVLNLDDLGIMENTALPTSTLDFDHLFSNWGHNASQVPPPLSLDSLTDPRSWGFGM
jgi:hypothetical protein